MKLKVCHIIPRLIESGAAKQMALLAKHLDHHQFEKHVIVLEDSGPIESQLLQSGACFHPLRMRGQIDLLAYHRLIRILRRLSPHIVHTWNLSSSTLGRIAAGFLRVPIVVASERRLDSSKTLVHRWIDHWLEGCTDCFATNSSSIRDYYSTQGIERQKIRVIRDAVVTTNNALMRHEVFDRLGLLPRRYVVGIVGGLWPHKGHLDLIWAAELLRVALKEPHNPANNVWVVILGDGPERERLQRLRDKYGSQDVVRFAGHRLDAEELISGMDILWNGSLSGSQNTAIMEAMAACVPVVATDIPGNRQLITDSLTGFLYPPGDTGMLARITFNLLQDKQRRSAVGMNAQQEMRNRFGIEEMVESYAQLYADLWAQSGKDSK